MIIYDKDKKNVLKREDLDLNKGYLIIEKELVHHEAQEYIPEKGHYITLAEYPNGGKDVEWVIDVPMQEQRDAYDEEIEYQIYEEYTEDELELIETEKEIAEYKRLLQETNDIALEFLEGEITAKDFASTKKDRQEYRKKIKELEKKKSSLTK